VVLRAAIGMTGREPALPEEAGAKVDNVPGLLKAFVLAGGILIIAGTAALVAAIMLKGRDDDPQAVAGPVDLALPPGSRVEQVIPDGRRLVLLGVDDAGQQFILLIEAATGEQVNMIRLQPGS
jgi:hypothetical protein